MKVVSVNRGERQAVNWRGQMVETGIFKYPIDDSIHLGVEDVVKDDVVDRRFHGGIDKAVYAYSLDHYQFWKQQYPNLDWTYGMFGENLTIEGLDETKMTIGSTYKIGGAMVQVCQPRQPCFKLGIRFSDQSVLKTFIRESFCGVYFRVVEEGSVVAGDEVELLGFNEGITIAQVYDLLYHKLDEVNGLIQKAIDCVDLPKSCKASIWKTQTGQELY